MAGVFFYWFSWIIWAMITFIMSKGRERTELALIVLLLIVFSGVYFSAGQGIEVCLSFIILVLYAYRRFAYEMKGRFIYYLFSCQIVTLIYSVVFIYSVYDPVIIIWGDRTWVMAAVVFLVVQALADSFQQRLIVAVIGISHGNILYELVTRRFSYSVEVGSLQYFDLLSAVVCIISLWHLYIWAAKAINEVLQKVSQTRNQMTNKSR